MKKIKIYAGIDPGINGAIVFMSEAGAIISVVDMPTVLHGLGKTKKRKVDIHELRLIFKSCKVKRAFLEMVSARPGQGVTSMFNFGVTYGSIQGMLIGMKIDFDCIVPQAWKRHFDLINADKDDARLTARNIFPEWESSFKYKKHVDRADAALICRYGIKNLTGEKK